MKLFESINNLKGITLNSQIVDLLSIIDDTELTVEEQDRKIEEYVSRLQERVNRRAEYVNQFGENSGKIQFLVDTIIDGMPGNFSSEQREKIKQIYLKSLPDLSMIDTSKMKEKLREAQIDENVVEYFLTEIKDGDYEAKEGILEMTPEKVRAFHRFMFGKGNKFDLMNIDNAGKYTGCISFDGKTFTPNRLDKMFEFAKRHGMQVKINAFMFYADFPSMYEDYCLQEYTTSEMSEEEKREKVGEYIKSTLFDYVKKVCERYGDSISAVDVLNEIIYDPDMIESEFKDSEERSYHQRTGQWMKYLNLDDLARLALEVRKRLPNARLLYNDVNWVNPDKRREIIAFIQNIQEKENEYRLRGELLPEQRGIIDTIGLEAHLDTSINISQLDKVLEDIERDIGLPVEVTELDIARTGKNPLSEEEILKQQKILARIYKLVNQTINGIPRIGAITMWSQSDDMCFVDKKCGHKVYGSVVDSNYEEKEFEPEKRLESLEMENESNRISKGRRLLEQIIDLSSDIRYGEILEETGKIIRTQKDLNLEQLAEEEQL